MNPNIQKTVLFIFTFILLFSTVVTVNAQNETDDSCTNNQSMNGQQGNNNPRNSNQPFFQGITVWIISIVVVILIIAIYLLINKSMKKQMEKNTKLIQYMIRNNDSSNQSNEKTRNQDEKKSNADLVKTSVQDKEVQRTMLKFLNYNENRVMKKLIEHDGSLLQSEISRMPNMGKVKAHRVLQELEKKGIISKEQYGKTNRIVLDEVIKQIFISSSS
jgi:uncharacterized membrane protein